jgi:hypothetical protein
MFNILYKGRKIHTNLSYEECADILDEISQKYYDNEEYDPNEIELEELNG